MNANTSSSVSSLSPMLGSSSALDQSTLSQMASTAPVQAHTNLTDLNKLLQNYALLNGYQSRAAEQELDPNLAATRKLQGQDVNQTYQDAVSGNISPALKNQFLKAGLTEGLASGGGVGKGSAGLSTLGNIFGTNFINYQNAIRGMAGQYLNANPMQSAGLDPSSAGNLRVGENQDNANLQNSWRQQLLQGQLNANSNLNNQAFNMGNAAAVEGQNNAQAKNATRGQMIGAATSLVGAAAGAAVLF